MTDRIVSFNPDRPGTGLPTVVEGRIEERYGRVAEVELTMDTAVMIPPGRVVTMILRQTGPGGHAVTWPAGVLWDGGESPTVQPAPDTLTVVTFVRAGDLVLGMLSGEFVVPGEGPTVTVLSRTDTTALVSWHEVAGATGYEVDAGGATVALGAAARHHQVAGLAPATAHTVSVRAITPGGNDGWATVTVTTLPTLAVAMADDFTAPDDTPVNGRVTPTGGVVLSSPGVNLAYSGVDASLITGGRVERTDLPLGGERFSWPITSKNVRISADYVVNNTTADLTAAYIGVGTGAQGQGAIASITRHGEVRLQYSWGDPVSVATGQPLEGRMTIQVEGDYVTVLINGQPVGTRIFAGLEATHAGVALWSAETSVDNIEVSYL